MQELKDRIVKEGKVLPGNIIKVDGFLNHRIDTELMDHIAEEFGKHFNMDEVTMILTAEASGIALATAVASRFHKPMIFAEKAKSDVDYYMFFYHRYDSHKMACKTAVQQLRELPQRQDELMRAFHVQATETRFLEDALRSLDSASASTVPRRFSASRLALPANRLYRD